MFLKNRNISSKIKRSKVTDYAALKNFLKTLILKKKSAYNKKHTNFPSMKRVKNTLFYMHINNIVFAYHLHIASNSFCLGHPFSCLLYYNIENANKGKLSSNGNTQSFFNLN